MKLFLTLCPIGILLVLLYLAFEEHSDFKRLAVSHPQADPSPNPPVSEQRSERESLLATTPQASPASASLDSLASAEQQSLWQALSEARREVRPIPKSWGDRPENLGYDFYAIHPRQKLRTRFGAGGVQLTSSSRTHTEADKEQVHTAWEARLQLTSFAGTSVVAGAVPVKSAELSSKVEYQHTASLTEWYINQDEGIEHGYTVATRPPHLSEGDAVELGVSMEGLKAENADSLSGDLVFSYGDENILTYSKLKVLDAGGRELEAQMNATKDGFLLAYHDAGATYPITVDPIIMKTKLTAYEVDAWDRFGTSVAVSGDTVVVGAWGEDDGGREAGSAFVFTRIGSGWALQGKLIANDAMVEDHFGRSVSISGDTVVVAANHESWHGRLSSGSAYVFTRTGNVWSQQQKLSASDGTTSDEFATSVSISGDTVVAGAPWTESAYVFHRSGSVWSQQQKLTPGADSFGESVSISGDTIVVGASMYNDGDRTTGSAYVFTRSGSEWSQQQLLTANDSGHADRFGSSVSISGDTMVVAASGDDDRGSASGSAYVFIRSGSVWSQQQKVTSNDAATDDQFGRVAVSGDTLVVGVSQDGDAGENSGSAYVFSRNGNVWSQQEKFVAEDAAAGDQFGFSVAISDGTVVVGAPYKRLIGNASGSVYLFTRDGNEWSQQQLPVVDGAISDHFGNSVSVYGDTLVVGTPGADDGGLDSGSAYVITKRGGVWRHLQMLTADDAAVGHHFGKSISISGSTLVVGAHPNDGSAPGSAYVYVQVGSEWTQEQKLTANEVADDRFGTSVSVFGDTVAIGAWGRDDGGNNFGSAHVFTRSDSVWSQQQELTANDGAADDRFGISVAISGNTVVVGAYLDDDAGSGSGSAYVFTREGNVWSQQQKLTANLPSTGDNFGISVSVSGDTAVVGAHLDDESDSNTGSAYIFARSDSGWSQERQLIRLFGATAEERFGSSVSVSGNTVVVGAPRYRGVSGGAWVYRRTEGAWQEFSLPFSLLDPADRSPGDQFGHSVAVWSDTVAVGAIGDDDGPTDSGSAWVFNTGFGNSEGTDTLLACDWLGTDLTDGASASPFAEIKLGDSKSYQFEVKNIGPLDLDVQSITLGGVDTGDFLLDLPDLSSSTDLGSGETLHYSIIVQPSGLTSGDRNASVSITSNSSPAVLSFNISALALSSETDSDNDGLNDWPEHRLSPLGFDWKTRQTDLVSNLYEFASLAGLFTEEQIGGLTGTFIIADVDPTTNKVSLAIELRESPDLKLPFERIIVDPNELSTDAEGRIRYEVDAEEGRRFYRSGFEQ